MRYIPLGQPIVDFCASKAKSGIRRRTSPANHRIPQYFRRASHPNRFSGGNLAERTKVVIPLSNTNQIIYPQKAPDVEALQVKKCQTIELFSCITPKTCYSLWSQSSVHPNHRKEGHCEPSLNPTPPRSCASRSVRRKSRHNRLLHLPLWPAQQRRWGNLHACWR